MSGTSVHGEGSKPSKLGRMSLNEFKAARLTCLGVSWKGCCFLPPNHRYLDLCGNEGHLVDRKTIDLASMHIHNAIVEQLVEKALSGTRCHRPPIGEIVASLKP